MRESRAWCLMSWTCFSSGAMVGLRRTQTCPGVDVVTVEKCPQRRSGDAVVRNPSTASARSIISAISAWMRGFLRGMSEVKGRRLGIGRMGIDVLHIGDTYTQNTTLLVRETVWPYLAAACGESVTNTLTRMGSTQDFSPCHKIQP